MHIFRFLIITLGLYSLSTLSFAGPAIKLCLNDNCKQPSTINITDRTWVYVKTFFDTPFPGDTDEQDNINVTIGLIEQDIYNRLSKDNLNDTSANELYKNNSTENHYRNTKTILGILLDNYLVTRHYMRKTVKAQSWSSQQTIGIMLQSISTADLYILSIDENSIESPTTISNYKKNKKTSVKSFFTNEYNDADDFE